MNHAIPPRLPSMLGHLQELVAKHDAVLTADVLTEGADLLEEWLPVLWDGAGGGDAYNVHICHVFKSWHLEHPLWDTPLFIYVLSRAIHARLGDHTDVWSWVCERLDESEFEAWRADVLANDEDWADAEGWQLYDEWRTFHKPRPDDVLVQATRRAYALDLIAELRELAEQIEPAEAL